jgi:hypothetical protein
VDSFLEALVTRDFERLAACLAPSVQVRLLLPRRTDEVVGRNPVRARLELWFGTASEFQVVNVSHDQIGARHRASWRFRVRRDGQSWESIEQVAFIDPSPDGIGRVDLLCSGFIPDESRSAEAPHAQAGATT